MFKKLINRILGRKKYEIVRREYCSNVTLVCDGDGDIRMSRSNYRKMGKPKSVQFLINAEKKMLAIKPTNKEDDTTVKVSYFSNRGVHFRSRAELISMLKDIMGIEPDEIGELHINGMIAQDTYGNNMMLYNLNHYMMIPA